VPTSGPDSKAAFGGSPLFGALTQLESLASVAASHAVLALFATTLFLSSFLLFAVEPMVAKMLLPMLGGVPMVWNTCVVFFQIVLVAGYAYAYVSSSRIQLRRSIVMHLLMLAVPFAALPLAIQPGWTPPSDGNPIPWLLSVLAATVGLPFFALSTNASVLQHWLSRDDHASSRDPYFLYAASNLGSLLALVAYPAIIEPTLTLGEQSRVWTIGYVVFVAFSCACALIVYRRGNAGRREPAVTDHAAAPGGHAVVTWRRRAQWLMWAFIPSSLMLAVTSYLTTDIASVPLFWIVPLALYLLTFVLSFSTRGDRIRRVAARAMPVVIIPLALCMIVQARGPLILVISLHLAGFACVALQCHGDLAGDRPATAHLTEFYLWVSLGGMLGGLFNTLAAPVLFTGIAEYPLVIVMAALFRYGLQSETPRRFARDLAMALGITALAGTLILGAQPYRPGQAVLFALLALPAVLILSQSRQRLRFGFSLAGLFVVGALFSNAAEPVLHAERTFFGVYRVMEDSSGRYTALAHGTTLHGMQAHDATQRREPLTYFHRTGPIGQVFSGLPHLATASDVAIVGLGIGTLASYAHPGQRWTLYEIDPAVERIARTSSYFTYLDACGDQCRVVLGDARLSLSRAQPDTYGLIVLDAFSSDAVPLHLVTDEALSLYLSRLAPGGALVFNISNRHVDLAPVLARLAASHHLFALEQLDLRKGDSWPDTRMESHWIVMGRTRADLGGLADDPRWVRPAVLPSTPLWRDDFSNLLSVLSVR
jgi:hypothetical protein